MTVYNSNPIHQIPAGMLPTDDRIEFVGDRVTRKVFFIQNGVTYPFSKLSRKHKKDLVKEAIQDPEAMRDLRGHGFTLYEALEEYTFCMYGAIDSEGDISAEGQFASSENFRCGANCRCLRWATKSIQVHGHVITPREIEVLDLLQTEYTDEAKADILSMTRSTLNTHKKHLFNKFNVLSVTSLVRKAIYLKIIQ